MQELAQRTRDVAQNGESPQPFDSATSDRTRMSTSDTTSGHLRASISDYLREYDLSTMGNDNTKQKNRTSKWALSYSKTSILEAESSLSMEVLG